MHQKPIDSQCQAPPSGWVLINMLHQVAQQQLIQWDDHPRLVLFRLCQDLFDSRNKFFPIPSKTKYMKLFEQEIRAVAFPIQFVPMTDSDSCDAQSMDEPEDLTQAIAAALQDQGIVAQHEADIAPTQVDSPAQPHDVVVQFPTCSTDQFLVQVLHLCSERTVLNLAALRGFQTSCTKRPQSIP